MKSVVELDVSIPQGRLSELFLNPELKLDTSSVTVSVTGRFVPFSPDRTRLLSEEVFRFKGLFNKLLGYLARGAIS